MQIYNREFSSVYDIEFTRYVRKAAPLIEYFYSQTSTSIANKTVLDLCCGTGQLAYEFLQRGYCVIGIDASKHMLAYARKINRKFISSGKAKFILVNILEYCPNQYFGLITCTYDSINHLDNEQELRKCFELAFRCLVEGGYLIFDINTRASLFNWNAMSISENVNRMIVSRGIYDGITPKAVISISGFTRKNNGEYEKFEQVIYNTVFETKLIEKLLREVGWSKVYFAKIEDLTMPIDSPETINKENELVVIACK